MIDQPLLFPELEEDLCPKIKNGDAVDVSTVDVYFEGDKEIHRKSNIMIDKLKSLPSGKFYAFKEGEDGYPYVKNIDTGTIYSVGTTRNQYPCVGFGKVTIACHRLFALLFVENPKTELYTEVDHINEDKSDFKLKNLRWLPSGKNISKKRKK